MNKLLHTTAFGALTLTSMYAYAQQDNRPNIIVILADDLGYSDILIWGVMEEKFRPPTWISWHKKG